jgi:hypothetical protein
MNWAAFGCVSIGLGVTVFRNTRIGASVAMSSLSMAAMNSTGRPTLAAVSTTTAAASVASAAVVVAVSVV